MQSTPGKLYPAHAVDREYRKLLLWLQFAFPYQKLLPLRR